METIAALVSAKEKLRTLKQLALLSDMAKECADSKKTLRLLKTLTKNRQKSYISPLTEGPECNMLQHMCFILCFKLFYLMIPRIAAGHHND